MLLQREYINPKDFEQHNAVFKMKQELTVIFLIRLLKLNLECFRKTQIVKDVVQPILEHIVVEDCDDMG